MGRRGRRRGRRLGVREAAAEGRAVAHPGRRRGGHPVRDRERSAASRRRSAAGLNPGEKAIQIQLKGQEAGELTRLAQQVAARGAPGARRRGRRISRPRVRSRSSRCRSIAAWPARSASPWARWRRRCGRRLPASTSATGSIRRARPATSRSASRPSRAPWWPIWSRCRWSWPDRMDRGRFRSGRWHASRRRLGPARIDHLDRERVITVEANTEGRGAVGSGGRRHGAHRAEREVPGRLRPEPGRRDRGSAGDLHADAARDRRRGDADVLRAGGAVRVVPRAVLDPAVAAAVAHRRDARAALHRRAARTS